MLSAGNLNTAALTLFLALNLSVERRLPWILLDDPVQSMDEIHVAQFAALLCTLARGSTSFVPFAGRHLDVANVEPMLIQHGASESIDRLPGYVPGGLHGEILVEDDADELVEAPVS
jgi:DNA repair protein SbcC/Rad50